jgi:hypothetical protein
MAHGNPHLRRAQLDELNGAMTAAGADAIPSTTPRSAFRLGRCRIAPSGWVPAQAKHVVESSPPENNTRALASFI